MILHTITFLFLQLVCGSNFWISGCESQLAEMSKCKATPFGLRRALIVEGGWLQTPWVPDSKMIDGCEYITLASADRTLAKALGMNMCERSPLRECSIFTHMAVARDAQVDALIFAAQVDNDPMAEASSLASRMQSRGRTIAFEKAKIPSTIVLKMPACVTP